MTPLAAVVLLAVAALVIGVAKSGFGGTLNILAVPLVASALRADVAVAVMLPVMLVADAVAIQQHGRHCSAARVKPALAGAGVGVAASGVLMAGLAGSPAGLAWVLQVAVGAVSVAMVAVQGWRLAGGRLPRVPDRPAAAACAGVASGLLSTLAHSAGPLMAAYLLEARLNKRVLTGTLVVFFGVMNLFKAVAYGGVGLFDPAGLALSAAMLLVLPAGSALGLWLHRRVPEKPFLAVVYAAAALAGGRMLWQAFAPAT
ncbi:hypothetical protein PSMK_04740 [Phycisphaera mikurensis NBRC 102666]|uniref:Probable membrane transporter protein n=1 Tax=Phycisphaera mikurensis (strain NBRC 102666 / KCTC 22515 / FYK2301M01) TaxID=1142394 RepID=I0IBJ5_PHYMF|nr:hypothetical protein PSMK_04740 [Phycisphaera mikurensis NBRC 102666]